jgi:uncharacterized protein (TIGR03083 family)
MENARYLSCLDADFTRFRQVVVRDPAAPVPSCPEWTVEDLTRHVGMVYLHKVASMRAAGTLPPGEEMEWPPPGLEEEATLDLLDRGYAELTAEFAARKPDEPAASWYEPDRSVAFWIRRMAQETVIHRVDAELALREPFAEIPEDLAVDGVDEILERFLAWPSRKWLDYFAADLPAEAERVLVRTGEHRWLLRMAPDGVWIEEPGADADATISGDPVPLLLWLWRRSAEGVDRAGDRAVADRLHTVLGIGTQ